MNIQPEYYVALKVREPVCNQSTLEPLVTIKMNHKVFQKPVKLRPNYLFLKYDNQESNIPTHRLKHIQL